ncbi:MAG: tetraacyldisaccharide 4'-kinase [Hyphomicrobiales bacterium]
MSAPAFWWRARGVLSSLLSPVSFIYALVADRPFGKGKISKIPILCIGNFVVGGAGKTPLAIALCKRLIKEGKKPVFLTRGYGGTLSGPHLVDGDTNSAKSVGDEPLLLCQYAPTVIAADRVAGVDFIVSNLTADVILMDDGFQSAKIKPASSMLVVDSARGLGNGYVIPAGPLRARLSTQIAYADCLVVIKGSAPVAASTARLIDQFKQLGKPVNLARLLPVLSNELPAKAIAFSGIGHPPKFFQSLRTSGVELVEEIGFPDHHFFTEQEAEHLLEMAEKMKVDLVTTSKDAIRLKGSTGALARLADVAQVFEVDVVFEESGDIDAQLSALMS